MILELIVNKSKLLELILNAEAEMGVSDDDAVYFRCNNTTAADFSGQRAIKDEVEWCFAQNHVAVQGELAEPAIGLCAVILEAGELGKLINMAFKPVTQAAEVNLLQTGDVELLEKMGDAFTRGVLSA